MADDAGGSDGGDGDRLIAGRYRLRTVLGRGGTGTVWAAVDELLGRPVAVKEVRPPPGLPVEEAAALRERTMREARAIAALSHPNVVTLFDVAREGENPYVVLELLESASLADVLRAEGPLSTERAAAVGTSVAAALQAAHAAGLTHRDVKPGNVLLAHDGRVKLTDFGIARNPSETTLTVSGLLLGSPAYMAPEVATGDPATPAADLWGLGATLFAAVEGRPPFDVNGDPVLTAAAVVHATVPTTSCPGPVGEVIVGLLVKDPSARMPLDRVRALLDPSADHSARANPTVSPRQQPPPVSAAPITAAPVTAGPVTAPPTGGVLAAAPGPLPFAASVSPSSGVAPSGRHPMVTAVVAVLAVVLFVASAATAAGAVRVALGADVVPSLLRVPDDSPSESAQPRSSMPAMRTVRLDLVEPGGDFPTTALAVVPKGWTEFRQQRVVDGFPGTAVRYVSPDGSQVATVERATGFGPDGDRQAYLDAYIDGLEVSTDNITRTPPVAQPDGGLGTTMRTVESGADTAIRRTVFLRLVPGTEDLWVLRVTVPTEREEAGRALFDTFVNGFAPTS